MAEFFTVISEWIPDRYFRSGRGSGSAYAAEQLYLRSPTKATVYTLPVISAEVGADVTAGILALQLHHASETVLLLYLGSDTKAVLHHQGKTYAASARGCGVFEGAGMQFGMRPENGAIEGVCYDGDMQLTIVGESLPRGICGSGLLE